MSGKPVRNFHVSSIVNQHEAVLFDRFIDLQSSKVETGGSVIECYAEAITDAAKHVFGGETTGEICGSFGKGTNIMESDVDMYIHTTYPVSEESQLELVGLLRKTFNHENIHLGRLAIHVSTMACDFDVVCSNTVQYGIRPSPNARIGESRTVQYAARGLKVLAMSSLPRTLSGYIIEDLTDTILTAYPLPSPVYGSGGLQLMISVLQNILDSQTSTDGNSNSSIYGLKNGTDQVNLLQNAARQALHQFLLAHPIRGGLHTVAEVALWSMLRCDDHLDLPGQVGVKIFDWIALQGGEYRYDSVNSAIYHRYAPSLDPTYEPPPVAEQLNCHTVVLFVSHVFYSQYLLLTKIKKNNYQKAHEHFSNKDCTPDQIGNEGMLPKYAAQGSIVAKHMIFVRNKWLEGEHLLGYGQHSLAAVKAFAESVRGSAIYSDPFSGRFQHTDYDKYLRAIEEVKKHYSQKSATTLTQEVKYALRDAYFVHGLLMMHQQNYHEAKKLMEIGVQYDPNDAYGLLYMIAMLCGCLQLGAEELQLIETCLAMHPQEAQFHYWKGVALKRTHLTSFYLTTMSDSKKSSMNNSASFEWACSAIESFHRFRSLRKVHQVVMEGNIANPCMKLRSCKCCYYNMKITTTNTTTTIPF